MGRPTLTAQIAKAAAEGDMEKVKELAARLEKNENKKVKPKKKKSKSKSEVEVYEEDLYQDEEDVSIENESSKMKKDSGFIARARDPEHRSIYIDENGVERVRSRVVPFKIVKNRPNKWEDDLQSNATDIDFDKKVHKNNAGSRNHRPPTNKVKVRCNRCNQLKVVWPGEVLNRNWACDECLTSNKPR